MAQANNIYDMPPRAASDVASNRGLSSPQITPGNTQVMTGVSGTMNPMQQQMGQMQLVNGTGGIMINPMQQPMMQSNFGMVPVGGMMYSMQQPQFVQMPMNAQMMQPQQMMMNPHMYGQQQMMAMPQTMPNQAVRASVIPKELEEPLTWIRDVAGTQALNIERTKSVDPHTTLNDLNEIIQRWDKYVQIKARHPKISANEDFKMLNTECMAAMAALVKMISEYGSKDPKARVNQKKKELKKKFEYKASIKEINRVKIKNTTIEDLNTVHVNKQKTVIKADDPPDNNGSGHGNQIHTQLAPTMAYPTQTMTMQPGMMMQANMMPGYAMQGQMPYVQSQQGAPQQFAQGQFMRQ